MSALPASLSSLTLFEPYGELVDASGGMIEYSDLLKRPLDAWKYLLLAIETGEVSLSFSTLPINAVMMASSNELHLNAFKEHPDYHSFRGRIQLIRVPYLRDYSQEQVIYETQIAAQVRVHVAPHAMYVAALWAVLSRLRRPSAEHFAERPLGAAPSWPSQVPWEFALLLGAGWCWLALQSRDGVVSQGGVAQVNGLLVAFPLLAVAGTAVLLGRGVTALLPREIFVAAVPKDNGDYVLVDIGTLNTKTGKVVLDLR